MKRKKILKKAVGTWEMVSTFAWCVEDGEKLHYYGKKPSGILCYHPDGYMSAQILNNPRERFSVEDWNMGSDAEIREAFLSYQAYFGKYDYDKKLGAMIHKVEGSIFPNWHLDKSKQVRYVRFEGDFLHIRTPEIEIKGKKYFFYIKWKKHQTKK